MTMEFPDGAFERLDEQDDALFYSFPRMVVHIDSRAIRATGEIFAQHLPKQARLLDLMSSWRSHLPEELAPREVAGLGLNAFEMRDNPDLTDLVVHDLNRDPRMPLADASFDGAMLTVSVQYLVRPIEVFADTGRVLRAGAPLIVVFSNRMFHTKAVRIWREAGEPQRIEIVKSYFEACGMFERIEAIDRGSAIRAVSDPIYAVIGWRRAAE